MEDQLFAGRRYTEQQGWKLLEEHVYTDEALSRRALSGAFYQFIPVEKLTFFEYYKAG